MAFALAKCDFDHVPAYLESSNPRNIPFYQRHGFEPLRHFPPFGGEAHPLCEYP